MRISIAVLPTTLMIYRGWSHRCAFQLPSCHADDLPKQEHRCAFQLPPYHGDDLPKQENSWVGKATHPG
jgi:hypothetical protein